MTYSLVLPDQIIDNLSLQDAQDIAEDYVSRAYEGFTRRASWYKNQYQLIYLAWSNGAKIEVASIENHERIVL